MLDSNQMDTRNLRNAFGLFATGVTVITMRDDQGTPTGVTVNSFSSLSLEPPLCLFSLGKQQVSTRWLTAGSRFTVNILDCAQEATAWQFATPKDNKFDGVKTQDSPGGGLILDGSLGWFDCRQWSTYDGGDHVIVVGEITDFATSAGDPMLFYRGKVAALSE